MTELTRLKVGSFDMADAFTLSQIQAMADLGEEEVNSQYYNGGRDAFGLSEVSNDRCCF